MSGYAQVTRCLSTSCSNPPTSSLRATGATRWFVLHRARTM
jgi:hypothetical protein